MTQEKFEKKMRFWSLFMTIAMAIGIAAWMFALVCTTFDWNPIKWFKNFKLRASEALKKRAEDKKAAHEAKKKTKKGYTRVAL